MSFSDVWNYFLKIKKNTALHFHCILLLVAPNNQVSKTIFSLFFRGNKEHINNALPDKLKIPLPT